MNKKLNKKVILFLWLAILIIGISAYYLFPQTFNLAHLILLIKDNYWLAVTIFCILVCFRGLLLISPLSLTLASSVLFPPFTVFWVNTLGFVISTILIYRFSEFLNLSSYFENRYQKQIVRIKNSLEKKEIPIMIAWSFLPILPTDLITYVSATLKIKLWKCLIGVLVGTAVINAIFIYSLNFFFPQDAAILNDSPVITSASSVTASNLATASSSPLNPPIVVNQLIAPLTDARSRVTKKPFGLKVSPQNSPVSPEKFSGYYTGVDFETFPSEANQDVTIAAVCSGPLLLKKYATGYGGVAVQKCILDKQIVTIIYGHLKLTSIKPAAGNELKAGENFAVLGKGYSSETDGERKHLHLGIHQGATINILGYVANSQDLANWLNALDYLP